MHIQAEVQNHLIKIQSAFRDDLLSKVDVFKRDTEEFYKDYATVCSHFRITKMAYAHNQFVT